MQYLELHPAQSILSFCTRGDDANCKGGNAFYLQCLMTGSYTGALLSQRHGLHDAVLPRAFRQNQNISCNFIGTDPATQQDISCAGAGCW